MTHFFSADSSNFTCTKEDEGKLRVHGTALSSAGHVEICHSRIWGVICANNWGSEEAKVACHQLGFDRGQGKPVDPQVLREWQNKSHLDYTTGSGPRKAWLGHVYCAGSEEKIVDCTFGTNKRPMSAAYHFEARRTCFETLELAGVNCTGE